MATEGQKTLIRTIMSEREMEGHHIEWVEDRLDRADTALIQTIMTRLKALPRKGAVVQAELPVEIAPARELATEEGFYLHEGDVFRIVRGKMSGNLYAKKSTASGWNYEAGKGMMRHLFADEKMTGEQIAEFGVEHEFCVVCSTGFEDPTSMHIGIGPVCGPRVLTGGKEAYKALRATVAHLPDVQAFEAAKKAAAKAKRDAKKQLMLV